jgi:CRP/FNR family transcriptional regulator, dissimilatory nitrate respiration regulator
MVNFPWSDIGSGEQGIIGIDSLSAIDQGQLSLNHLPCAPCQTAIFCRVSIMSSVDSHPEKNVIRVQLTQNTILHLLTDAERIELEHLLTVVDCQKGDFLLHQGVVDMEQYFVLDGILKRVVANPQGKEMILRFADARDLETSYAAWRLGTPTPYSIVSVTKSRVAKLPLPQWITFMEKHAAIKAGFEYEVMRLMSEIMGHTITLHLLDAPGRVNRFVRKHPELFERLPKKELAAYLNLSAETLSRLKQRGKI